MTATARSPAGMHQRANDFEQAGLIGTSGDLAAQLARGRGAPDLGGRKTPGRCLEHRQIRFRVSDRYRLPARVSGQREKRLQPRTLMAFCCNNRRIGEGLMQSKPAEIEVYDEPADERVRQRNRRAPRVGISADDGLILLIEKHAGNLPKPVPQFL